MHSRAVLVVDFGAQYAQLIARRVREAQVYSEVVPHTTPVAEILASKPAAIVLSGGPASVYALGAPRVDPVLFEAGVPVLGICYGFQAMADALGGVVQKTGTREYGRTDLQVLDGGGVLHRELPARGPVWMSHGDAVTAPPEGFAVTARSAGAPVAAFEDPDRRLAGVQYHPEVVHSPHGQEVLRRFLHEVAGIRPSWTTANVIDETVAAIRAQTGGGKLICGLSGGVDSAVAAALVHRAVGDDLTCVFVDHGLLRAGERAQVERDYVAATGVRLVTVDARERFLDALAGVVDPEQKRKIIGREFIRVFEAAARDVAAEAGRHGQEIRFLVQGTLYPDVVESGGGSGTANIKSHHNVGGLPEDLKFELVEPLRALFKDEVRRVVTAARLETLRAADAIAREELTAAGMDRDIWQCPVVLLAQVRSVGVQGDGRTYGHPVVLRPVSSEDAMTADWSRVPYDVLARISGRITNEVPKINRVVLDVTSKPPGTIEWE
jgi:GMP synthase (glutamine-hydrolysing)